MIDLISLGSCTPLDILKTDSNFYQKYNLIYKHVGSISRYYYPANNIALKILNEKSFLETKNAMVKDQINAILKDQNPMSVIRSAPKNTVILLDFAYEIWRYFYDGNELFDICGFYPKIANLIPAWLNNTIISNIRNFDNGDMRIARMQYELLEDFLNKLTTLPYTVIIFGNTFTPNVYFKQTKSVGQMLPLFNQKIGIGIHKPFFTQMMSYRYSEKIINNFYGHLNDYINKRSSSNLFKFEIDINIVYSDPDHYWGYHPGHYHYTCRKALVESLSKTIEDAISKRKLASPRGFQPELLSPVLT